MAILTSLFLAGAASAQWTPRTDQTGYTYFHAKNHAAQLIFDTVKVIAMPTAPTSER